MAGNLWERYPVHTDRFDPTVFDHKIHNQRLESLAGEVFRENYPAVLLIDNFGDRKHTSTKVLNTEDELEAGLSTIQSSSRIISLSQNDSFEPVNISLKWMKLILAHYHVMPEFLDVLLQFGSRGASVFEQNSSSIASKSLLNRTYNICYNLPYIEPNGRSIGDPVSRRQTGVFYRYDAQTQEEFAILLSPMMNSRAEARLKELNRAKSSRNPLDLHCVIISSYICNWRPYIESLAEQISLMRQKVLAISIESDNPVLKASTLATLRTLEDKIIFRTLGGLTTAIKIVRALIAFNERLNRDGHTKTEVFRSAEDSLLGFLETLQGHVQSVEIMEKRMTATISSWSSLLELRNQSIELRNQRTAEETNTLMLRLNLKSVDDNTTVKLITILTLVYLPASFVASLFGMEFFGVNEETNRFQVSSEFWIFFALALPLTAVTLTVWRICISRRQKSIEREDKAVA